MLSSDISIQIKLSGTLLETEELVAFLEGLGFKRDLPNATHFKLSQNYIWVNECYKAYPSHNFDYLRGTYRFAPIESTINNLDDGLQLNYTWPLEQERIRRRLVGLFYEFRNEQENIIKKIREEIGVS